MVKRKGTLIAAVTALTVLGATVFAFAGTSTAATTTTSPGLWNRTTLTTEQKAAMDEQCQQQMEQRDAVLAKWNALTAAQKNEIYDLKEKASAIDSKIIDKYLEYGIVDQPTADNMKTMMNERNAQMRTDGQFPMIGGKGPGCPGGMRGHGGFHGAPPADSTNSGTTN